MLKNAGRDFTIFAEVSSFAVYGVSPPACVEMIWHFYGVTGGVELLARYGGRGVLEW